MFEIEATSVYSAWFRSLRDRTARTRIAARMIRLQACNFGDVKPVGAGVYELRLAFGPGYRVYYARQGERIILLLCGGDKGSQSRDIARAKQLMSEME
jgi:putative addiction module killer protein